MIAGQPSRSPQMITDADIQLHSRKFPVERKLAITDKTVEKTSFEQWRRSLGRDGRLPDRGGGEGDPLPPAMGTLSLTRAGRLAGSRSTETISVERQTTGIRDQLLQPAASLGNGIDNPAMESPYGVYRGAAIRASGRAQPPEYGQAGQPAAAAGGFSGSDDLRDACSRMFQRDGWGRGSQSASRATLPPALGPGDVFRMGPDGPEAPTGPDPSDAGQDRTKNNTLTKKYYHIKDMISNRLGKLGADQAARPPPDATATPAQNNAANGRASNINSSFRKAMQHNTQKSNMNADESGMLYSMSNLSMEGGRTVAPWQAQGGNGQGQSAAPQYGYASGFGAAASRLGQLPQPPTGAHPGHPQYGAGAGVEHPTVSGASHYGSTGAGLQNIYGTTAQPAGGTPWQQQRPLPPQPYPGPPPPPPVSYGAAQLRPALPPHPLRPPAPPAYGTHQANGPHLNGQHLLTTQPIYGQHPSGQHPSAQHPSGQHPSGQHPPAPPYSSAQKQQQQQQQQQQQPAPPYSGAHTGESAYGSAHVSVSHSGPGPRVVASSGQQTSAGQQQVGQQAAAQQPIYGRRPGGAEGIYGQRPPPPVSDASRPAGAAAVDASVSASPHRQHGVKDPAPGHSSDSGHGSGRSAGGETAPAASAAPLDSSLDSDAHSGRQTQQMAAALQAGHSSGNDSEWVDMVETELRQILDPRLFRSPGDSAGAAGGGSRTPDLPALPGESPAGSRPGSSGAGRHSQPPDLLETMSRGGGGGRNDAVYGATGAGGSGGGGSDRSAGGHAGVGGGEGRGGEGEEEQRSGGGGEGGGRREGEGQGGAGRREDGEERRIGGVGQGVSVHRSDLNSSSRSWGARVQQETPLTRDVREQRSHHRIPINSSRLLSVSSAGRTDGDVTSLTTGLDLESMLDQTTDRTTDDESTVLEAAVPTADSTAIRQQLESLEGMYSEVLRLLGGGQQRRGPPAARLPRTGLSKHRVYGSMSSLPSSIGARPVKERRRDERKNLKDMKGVNKRFQRLESHVVTLARSVAHLSSEMRTQHLMFQELESIRTELTQLRTCPGRGLRTSRPTNEFEAFRDAVPSLTHPGRVRKLTKFFGDEPPLLRIFLKKMGYEKYAALFERERIGMIELPYMTEDRLQKLGIPLGPRLRILQEAQMSLRNDNFNVYIL